MVQGAVDDNSAGTWSPDPPRQNLTEKKLKRELSGVVATVRCRLSGTSEARPQADAAIISGIHYDSRF